MKKIILSIFCSVCLSAWSYGQSMEIDPVQDSFFEEPTLAQGSKKEISFEELPQVVQDNFYNSEYMEWNISYVFEEIDNERSTIYEIVVSNATVEQALRYDVFGNMIQP